MKHPSTTLCLLAITVLLWCWGISGCSTKPSAEEQMRQAVVQQYQNVGKLILAESTLQKAVTLQDPQISFYDISGIKDLSKWLIKKTKIGSRVGIYSFQATLVAYTDLSRFKPEDVVYDDRSATLTLYIAPIEIELRGREFTLHTDYEYVAPLREPITPQERATVKNTAYRMLQEEIANNTQLHDQLRQRSLSKLRSWIERLSIEYEVSPQINIVEQGLVSTPPTAQ